MTREQAIIQASADEAEAMSRERLKEDAAERRARDACNICDDTGVVRVPYVGLAHCPACKRSEA